MKTGDIILVKGEGFISGAIEEISHSKYSHAAIYINNDILIEAEGFEKTGAVKIDKYEGKTDIFTCGALTSEQQFKILKYLIKQVGTKYDYLLLFWEAIRYIFHVALPYREYHSHICSSLVVDAYRSAGIDLCPGIKYPSPGDIANSNLLRKIGSL